MTGRSMAISLLAHAALLALIAGQRTEPAPPPDEPAAEVELVEVTPAQVTPPVVEPAVPSRAAAAAPAKPRSPGRARVVTPGPLSIEPEVRGDVGSGSGSGDGSGIGGGIGSGTGSGIEVPAPPLASTEAAEPPSRSAPRSKARPARLIFPKKQRTEEDGAVFVALLTVDDEGYVVGVRLKQGIGGRRDEVAQREVWRFRYDPARDDAGRPIGSRVEQRFMVE